MIISFWNLNFAMLSKNFSWSGNFALTNPGKINGHSVTCIVDTRKTGIVVSQSCADNLGLKEEKCLASTLTVPNNRLSQEIIIFKVLRLA